VFTRRLAGVLALAALIASSALVPAGAQNAKPDRGRRMPALAPVKADALTRALDTGSISEATYALQRARALFQREAVERRYGALADVDPHSATLIMRDLAIRYRFLSDDEQESADRVLARPDDPEGGAFGDRYTNPGSAQMRCLSVAQACIHWVTAPDTNAALSSYVDLVELELQNVWDFEIVSAPFHFLAPPSDAAATNNGGPGSGGKLDVYLADLGAIGIYGYCATDDPGVLELGAPTGWSYCVLDNNYDEFDNGHTPQQNLQVTTAHEFFHAVQGGYDYWEEPWVAEGTASWMEDAIYDPVDDNYQYLLTSQMTDPATPIDYYETSGPYSVFPYGSWYFWRLMSEGLSPNTNIQDPSVIREVWEQLAAAGPDLPAIPAVAAVSAGRGLAYEDLWAAYGVYNYFPEAFYEEGSGYLSFLADFGAGRPPALKRWVLQKKQTTGNRDVRVDHLAHGYIVFRPQKTTTKSRLKINVNGPNRGQGPVVTVVVLPENGNAQLYRMELDASGGGSRAVSFKKNEVDSVVLDLSNSSPVNDRLKFTYKATVKG
jgi:hypothetical protein